MTLDLAFEGFDFGVEGGDDRGERPAGRGVGGGDEVSLAELLAACVPAGWRRPLSAALIRLIVSSRPPG